MSADQDRRDRQRVLDGDVEAFRGIVERWQGPLVNLAYRFCGDPSLAEELAQEAFLQAYRKLGGWRGEGALSTWLFAVATNVYRSKLRRRRLPTVPLDALAGAAVAAAGDEPLEAREERRLVRAAVRRLPGRYREAILLFYFLELDLREAAAVLGLPEGTLKSHLHRGRKLLEKRLARLLGGRSRNPEDVRWSRWSEHSSPTKS